MGLTPNIVQHLTFVLETGAGPNFITTTTLLQTWQQDILSSAAPQLRTAGIQPLAIMGVLHLLVGIGDLRVKVTIAVVDGLVTGALFETFFFNKFVRGIFPTAKLVQPINSPAISILSRDATAPDDPALLDLNTTPLPTSFKFLVKFSSNLGRKCQSSYYINCLASFTSNWSAS